MMKKISVILFLCKLLLGSLIPDNFMSNPDIQRAGFEITQEYFSRTLFNSVYGIAFTRLRNTTPQGELMVSSDCGWHRLIYTYLEEEGDQSASWIKAYGKFGNGSGRFDEPMGLCIDTTIYNGISEEYTVYVADRCNDRVVRLKYNINTETLVNAGIFGADFSKPKDVACVSKSDGGAYVVVIEEGNDRISLYGTQSNGTIYLVQRYGELGAGVGKFGNPSGIAICEATDGQGGYYLYIADTDNNRIVCLRFHPGQGISWERSYTKIGDPEFLSVTASQYYCVYVTAFRENRVYVFTPGLTELLYEYGNDELLNGPKDVYIDWDRIGLTERWTATTGIQYFKIIPEVKVHPGKSSFDATVDSVGIYFDVYETAGEVTISVAGQTIMEPQHFCPDKGYFAGYWDGRDGDGNVVVPGNYVIRARSLGHTAGTATVVVKGTKIEGEITDLHWQPSGNPYVLVDNSYIGYDDTLIIDPNVLVMGHTTNTQFEVDGILRAIGSVNDSIIFTSHRKLDPPDPTNSEMWRGIVSYFNSAQSEIKFCRIEYAGVGVEIWSNFYTQVPNNIIENCYFYTNTLPARCDFYSTGAFGYGNEYIDNDINKIIVIEPPSDNPPPQNRPAGLNDITIKDQDIPFWFRQPYYFKYQVGGSEDSVMTLTIEPGTRLEFDENTALEIGIEDQWGGYARGRILAEGLENDSITFTGVEGGFWKGVRFCSTSCIEDTSVISYASIEYAGQDTASIVLGDSTSINITDSRVYKSKNYGIWSPEGSPYNNIIISNCLFEEDSVPIRTAFRNLGGIQTCTFVDNQLDAIEVVAGKDATHRDITIHNYPIPYNFLNDPEYGPEFSIYGDQSLATLTVEPGTQIHCDADIQINIGDISNQNNQGKITALGDAQNQIIFTALNNKTPWSGIYLYSYNDQAPSTFDYCEISHAKDVGIFTKEASTTVNNSRISNCGNGIIVDSLDANPNITGNVITLNYCGVHNTNNGSTLLELHNNDIFANKIAVRNDLESYDINATLNWFGDVTGPWDPTEPPEGPPDYNPAGRGDSIGDYIIYRPWLDTPIQPYQVTLIQPNGEDTLYGGSEYEIQWSVSVTPTRQELYFTTDFPEGGSAREDALWKFIDTVDVNLDKYVWTVPLVASKRCRVAVKIYYDADRNDMTRENDATRGLVALQNSKNEYESRNTNTISVDISDSNFTILITTDISYGTAFGKKLVRSPDGRLHFVFSDIDQVLYQYSDNKGETWFELQSIGQGEFPTIVIGQDSCPCIIYGRWEVDSDDSLKGWQKVFVIRYTGSNWTEPKELFTTGKISKPVEEIRIPKPFAGINSGDTISLVWVAHYQANLFATYFGRFDIIDQNLFYMDTLLTQEHPETPCHSLAVDDSDIVHIVYEKWGVGATNAYYRYFDQGLSSPTIVCSSAIYPYLDYYPCPDNLLLVWDGYEPGPQHRIQFRQRELTDPWQDEMTVYEPVTWWHDAHPVISGWYAAWADTNIYYSRFNGNTWEPRDTIATRDDARFPQTLFYQDADDTLLFVAFTSGINPPYNIEFQKRVVPRIPRFYADCGQETPSSYCLVRDGYWIFGDKPYESVDYDNDSLVYRFTDLDPAKEYRLDLAYYFEPNPRIDSPPPTETSSPRLRSGQAGQALSSPFKEEEYREGYPIKRKEYDKVNIPLDEDEEMVNENHQHDAESRKKGIGRLIQALVIDGVRLDSAFIVPHKLVRVSIWLPNELYADGEIIIEIEKIKGKVVVCGEIALYEFGGEEKCSIANTRGGPQSNETMQINPVFFEGIHPNPAVGDLMLKFNSLDQCNVRITLYDVTGRLVNEIFDGKAKIGMNEYLIMPNELSAGVYFVRLETSGYEKTEKIILVR